MGTSSGSTSRTLCVPTTARPTTSPGSWWVSPGSMSCITTTWTSRPTVCVRSPSWRSTRALGHAGPAGAAAAGVPRPHRHHRAGIPRRPGRAGSGAQHPEVRDPVQLEVRGQQACCLGAQEGAPTGVGSPRCGAAAGPGEDAPDGAGADVVAKSGEFALDAVMPNVGSPARVVEPAREVCHRAPAVRHGSGPVLRRRCQASSVAHEAVSA